MEVNFEMKIYQCWIREFVEKHKLEVVPFNTELINSEHHIRFSICFGDIKIPLTLMFWQNLDRLRHKIEEAAYVPCDEWVRIPFSQGHGDPIDYISLKFYDKGRVFIYVDSGNPQVFLCEEKYVIKKLYYSLLEWTKLYDDSQVGLKRNEYFYSKAEAYKHLKSPIIEEYIQDIEEDNYQWRHYASEPGEYWFDDYEDEDDEDENAI